MNAAFGETSSARAGFAHKLRSATGDRSSSHNRHPLAVCQLMHARTTAPVQTEEISRGANIFKFSGSARGAGVPARPVRPHSPYHGLETARYAASARWTCWATKRPTSWGWVAVMKCAAVSIVASAALLMHSLSSALARCTAG